MSLCPSVTDLDLLLDGRLSEPEAGPVRDHLSDCTVCGKRLDQMSEPAGVQAWRGCATAPALPTDARLNRLIEAIRETPLFGNETSVGNELTNDQAVLPLGPPTCAGDLGTLGPYRIVSEVGRGGMGVVFKAFDAHLARAVAVKILRPDRADDAARRRFVREARATAAVRHDHVVPVFAVSDAEAAVPYLVMEFIEGPTLRQRLTVERRLDPREAARMVLHAADGLAAAHALGLIHRDVKPANIIHDLANDRARIVDFGLVCAADRGDGTTRDGTVRGTPEYMSPEHVRSPEDLDARADVYCLGVTLYELLTGDVPFRGAPHMIVQRVLNDEPLPPRRLNDRVPRDLETICLKAMAKEPGRRYSSATDLRDDLSRFLAGEPVRARPARALERLMKAARRRPAMAGLVSALFVTVILGFAGVTWMWSRSEANAATARENELKERKQRDRALEHLAVAKEAVDKFYTNIYEKGLLNDRNLAAQKKGLIVDALRFYQRMLDLELEDPNLIHAAAETAARIGLLIRDIDEVSVAVPYLARSVELARAAVAADPSNVNRKLLLAKNATQLGTALQQTGDLPKAESCGQESVAVYSDIVRAFPTELKYRRDLTAMQVNLANLAFQRGDRAAAKAGFEAARENFQQISLLSDRPFVAQLDLARIEYNLHFVADSNDEALAWLEKSCNLRRDLYRKDPSHGLARRDFILSCDGLARGYIGLLHQRPRALDIISEGIEVARLTLKTDPNHLEFQHLLTTSLHTAGVLAHKLGRYEDAERYWQESAPLVLNLLEKDRARHRLSMANLLAEKVEIKIAHDRSAEVDKDRRLAIQLLDEYLPIALKMDTLREQAEALRRRLIDSQ